MEGYDLKKLSEMIAEQIIFCKKDVLTSQEAAKYMGISISYLYKLTMNQEIPHFKPMGKMCYFNRLELEKWLQSNRILTSEEVTQKAQLYCMNKDSSRVLPQTKPKYKKGDFLVTPTGIVFIYSGEQAQSKGVTRVGVLARITDGEVKIFKKGEWNYASSYDLATVRYANKEERKEFLNEMKRIGKEYDSDRQIVVDYVWPKEKEIVYIVGSNGKVRAQPYDSTGILKSVLESGNCFRTEAEAQAMADKFKELLKNK